MPRRSPSLRQRIALRPAELKEATSFIVEHHYLHRGRRMAQLAYWIDLDDECVGVILYSLPRISVSFHGYHPMQVLELARLWVHPKVQGRRVLASDGRVHTFAVAGSAVAASLRTIRSDWMAKYPKLPKPLACVAWADLTLHVGTIYRATNFRHVGVSGGRPPGAWVRPNGGTHLDHADYRRRKAAYLFEWPNAGLDPTDGEGIATSERVRPRSECHPG